MYRNVYFDRKHSTIHQWTWDQDGSPYKKEAFFKPYVYVPSADPKVYDAVGIDMVPLIKKEFNYDWERRKFVERCKSKVYFNLPPTQQYLLENYYHKDITELTQFPLRTFFFDIEVIADEFPKADEAKFPITSITIYDSETKRFYVWGIHPYDEYSCKDDLQDIQPEDIVYIYCPTEKNLLIEFLKFWRKNYPDVIIGYNSYQFDMPYIVHRIEKVFGEGKSSKLSPVDNIYGSLKENKFFQKYTEYTIGGVAHLDYMVLYKTFTPGERPSDALDFVCEAELGFGKLDYGDQSLKELYQENWSRFINYNIWDVKLLILLDEQKKYLDIAKFSAFSGFCNLDKAFGKTAIITGVLAKQSLEKGQIIPTQSEGKQESIPGGYVKEIQPGLYEDVVSVDCNSLYPSNIITLNISPETKMAKVIRKNDDGTWKIWMFKERLSADLTKEELDALMKKKNWARSASGVFFDQSSMSVSAAFCDSLYNKRKKVKDEMLAIEKRLNNMSESDPEYKRLQVQSSQKDVEQYLYKILLNSTYGAFANRFFSLYDADCAKAITLTGQAMIKKTEEIVNKFMIDEWGLEQKDRVIGMDTDSALFTISDICEKYGVKLIDEKGDLTPEFVVVENKITEHLNIEIQLWAKDKLNSTDPRYFFKRESVCPKAMWTGKKHYILYLVNKEGKKMDKFKYSGLSIAKSTFSDSMKQVAKDIVKIIMTNKDKKKADELFYDTYDNFRKYSVVDIAERGSIKVLTKWDTKNKGFECAKGTTQRAKYSIYFNELLKVLGLENTYRRIENGSKIKVIAVKPNKYNIDGIAFQDKLPEEFGLEPDYHKMFYKTIVKSLESIYNALNWNVPDPKIQHLVSLEDLFGGD